MPSITGWTRLEPHPRSPRMTGFAARVADPLWALARQWQLGELTGSDAGTPVRADLTTRSTPISRYRPGLPDGTPGTRVDRMVPLEVTVEGGATVPDDRAAAVDGLDLLTRLGPLATPLRAALVAAHPLPAPGGEEDPGVRRRALMVGRGVPDGRTLRVAVAAARAAGDASTALPGLDRTDGAVVQAARAAAEQWLDAGRPAAPATGAPPAAWRPERLEYEFSLGAPAATGEHVLVAGDHGGGPLDWWSFDAAPGETLGAGGDSGGGGPVTVSMLPTSLTGPGLPAARFWQLEPGEVDLDAISAAPEDIGRLLFMEFALAYGDDFFVLPLRVARCSVTTIDSLTITTSFGETITVPPAADADSAAGREPFRLFQPDVAGAGRQVAPWLVVLPPGPGTLSGEPVEDVGLARDEMANLAWAIERKVPGRFRSVVDVAEAARRGAMPTAGAAAPAPSAPGVVPRSPATAYRLVTPVPPGRLPMTPASAGASGVPRPVLRAIGPAPKGTLLPPAAEIHGERLGRSGLRLTRRFQRARAADGRTFTWSSIRVAPGGGESSSGLRFDDLLEG